MSHPSTHTISVVQNVKKLFWLRFKGALKINTLYFHTECIFIQIKKGFSKHRTERMFLTYLKLLSGVLGLQLKDYRNNIVVSVRFVLFSYIQEKCITEHLVSYLPIPSEKLAEYLNSDTEDLHWNSGPPNKEGPDKIHCTLNIKEQLYQHAEKQQVFNIPRQTSI